jgi:hypothetical protein
MFLQAPNIVTNVAILLSPGLWLFLSRVFGRVPVENAPVAWWFSIGIVATANGLIYGIVGAAIVGLRKLLKQVGSAW